MDKVTGMMLDCRDIIEMAGGAEAIASRSKISPSSHMELTVYAVLKWRTRRIPPIRWEMVCELCRERGYMLATGDIEAANRDIARRAVILRPKRRRTRRLSAPAGVAGGVAESRGARRRAQHV